MRKLHRLIGVLGTAKANLGGIINKGRCCNLGNFARTRLENVRTYASES